VALVLAPAAGAGAADDHAARAVQLHQVQRQQQEDALQLRMRQQQQATRLAPADARRKQALDRLHAGQRARQQALHDRQVTGAQGAVPADDEATRAAKAGMELRKAQDESQRLLQRLQGEQPAP
jgi:hypothetical protein